MTHSLDGLKTGIVVYQPDLVAADGSPGVYRYTFYSSTGIPFNHVDLPYTLLAASVPLIENDLAYYMRKPSLPAYEQEFALFEDSRIGLIFPDVLTKEHFIP